MRRHLSNYAGIIRLAIPSLISIILVELVSIEFYLNGPVKENSSYLVLWITLQLIPGFFFGYISDLNFRKATLVICQLLGIVGGLILSLFGFELWVLVLIGLTFNPLPIARAALLDHFPHHSTVKLVAITFLAQYIPWAFYGYLTNTPYTTVIYWIIGVMTLNAIGTLFLFPKDQAKKHVDISATQKLHIIGNNPALIFSVLAFIFAEAAFYLVWAFYEYDPSGHIWLSLSTMSTIAGICLATLYTRLPHISIISLFYSIGAAITLMAFFHCCFAPSTCDNSLETSVGFYAIIGGLYLPFVTDAVIKMLGPSRRAIGSATIEFGDTIACFIAPILNVFNLGSFRLLSVIVMLFGIATILQKTGENRLKLNL